MRSIQSIIFSNSLAIVLTIICVLPITAVFVFSLTAPVDDAFAKFGIIGVLMRIEDKIQRALSITKNGITMVDDESIRDTLMDLHNYSAMGVMLLDEKENKSEISESNLYH